MYTYLGSYYLCSSTLRAHSNLFCPVSHCFFILCFVVHKFILSNPKMCILICSTWYLILCLFHCSASHWFIITYSVQGYCTSVTYSLLRSTLAAYIFSEFNILITWYMPSHLLENLSCWFPIISLFPTCFTYILAGKSYHGPLNAIFAAAQQLYAV